MQRPKTLAPRKLGGSLRSHNGESSAPFTVLVDIDGVVVPTPELLRKYLNNEYKLNLRKEDLDGYPFHLSKAISHLNLEKPISDWFDHMWQHDHESIPLMDSSIPGVHKEWNESGIKIIIGTGLAKGKKLPKAQKSLKDWLAHFDVHHDEIHHVASGAEKLKIPGIDVGIDDDPTYIKGLESLGIKGVLPDWWAHTSELARAHGPRTNNGTIIPVSSWTQLRSTILELHEAHLENGGASAQN